MTFGEFMEEVDIELIQRVGVGHLDLPDFGYRDAYDDELDPSEVASDVIEQGF